jgi:hypothetical protein
MKAKYILVPKDHALAGQRRKVRCKCTDGKRCVDIANAHYFTVGKYSGTCPVCNYHYFYVE